MTTLKAVIGANYGDEGKGKMTDYFASNVCGDCIVVCTNGGAQRGHTVVTKEDGQHVFHHFGSGTFAGADTYLPARYVANPILFMKELKELNKYSPIVYVNANAYCSTPYDMIANQIIEEERGANKHGSCGCGIWETILRNEATIGEMIKMLEKPEELFSYLRGVRDTYFINRIEKKGFDIPKRWKDIYFSEQLIINYVRDLYDMSRFIVLQDTDSIIRQYDNVIFENGQGLLLDQNIKDSAHSTPSNTGSRDIKQIVDNVFDDPGDEWSMEVCYVTRSYVTRHGEGELPNECELLDFINVVTETNIWNKNQGVFRYGLLDINDVIKRCKEDFNNYWCQDNAKISFAITHLDEKCNGVVNINEPMMYGSFGTDRHETFWIGKEEEQKGLII